MGAVVDGVVGGGGGGLALALLPSWTSPMSLLLSRLNISSLRGSCLRGSSVSLGAGVDGGEVLDDVAANVGKKGVAVVGGSVDTRLSGTVGRNTEEEEISSSKLTSSSPSEL